MTDLKAFTEELLDACKAQGLSLSEIYELLGKSYEAAKKSKLKGTLLNNGFSVAVIYKATQLAIARNALLSEMGIKTTKEKIAFATLLLKEAEKEID